MVYVTGDLHGDISRFHSSAIGKLKKNDTLIVCGDFGFVWNGDKKEKKLLKWIGKRKFNVAFADGCHDNYTLLNQYEETEWCGGKAHKISGKLYHLMRGNIYTIEGKTFFVFGGGESDDYDMRAAENKWWIEEQPSRSEVEAAVNRLKDANMTVDYIITHDAPRSLNGAVDMNSENQSPIHMFLDLIYKNCKFKMWFFGKYHMDKTIPPKYRAVFDDIVSVENFKKLK